MFDAVDCWFLVACSAAFGCFIARVLFDVWILVCDLVIADCDSWFYVF